MIYLGYLYIFFRCRLLIFRDLCESVTQLLSYYADLSTHPTLFGLPNQCRQVKGIQATKRGTNIASNLR